MGLLSKYSASNTRRSKSVRAAFPSFFKNVKDSHKYTENVNHSKEQHEVDDGFDLGDRARSFIDDLGNLGINDMATLLNVQKKKLTGELTDDKSYLMEGLIKAAIALSDDSHNARNITHGFITSLWSDLDHPPLSYGGKMNYRSADGSNNSILYPQLGAANTSYARTVKPAAKKLGALPDAGVIFDSVMARKASSDHPSGISSMLFYVASIIIHDLFHTDHHDTWNSQTSSYLDLSPLYGRVAEEQNQIRTFQDGKIKPDAFSEIRILSFPPGVACILIMFNRFHNYIVEQLALINECGRFNPPKKGVKDSFQRYDEDLFQTGRLITCGLYINIILNDYVRTILNLNRTDDNWRLDPRAEIRNGPPIGTGNQVSAEFNLVYRWHSAISKRDEEWTETHFQNIFQGKHNDLGSMDPRELMIELGNMMAEVEKDPGKRTFGGLQRQKDGTFKDDEVVKILAESIEDVANSFGAQRVPKSLRAIEILGIEQARAWNVATLNEFRKHFHLLPHQDFEDINSDPYVAEQLRRLYGHPDLVELYPGIVAEEAKKPVIPSSGLAPSFTVSRAILSDAVALVRGDRFYTIDYTPANLTNWGYSEADSDMTIDNGCVFYKLMLRAFPNHIKPHSVYAHYPLTIPSVMENILRGLGKADKYSFGSPKLTKPPTVICRHSNAARILDNQVSEVIWEKGFEFLMSGSVTDSVRVRDSLAKYDKGDPLHDSIIWVKEVKKYYEEITIKLLKEKSYKLAGVNQVDIIGDVNNLAHMHFVSELFSLPLQTSAQSEGAVTDKELYMIMSVIFHVIFCDHDPLISFSLCQKAQDAIRSLVHIVEEDVDSTQKTGFFSRIIQSMRPTDNSLKEHGTSVIKRLLDAGLSSKELVCGYILGNVGSFAAAQSQLFAHTIDYFFTEGQAHLAEISRLAKLDTDEADEILWKYILEGSRLYGEMSAIRSVKTKLSIEDEGGQIHLISGDPVLIDMRSACHDESAFPGAESVDLNRPIENYIHLLGAPYNCLGQSTSRAALTTMWKVIGRLDNLRPARGPQGELHKVKIPHRVEGVSSDLSSRGHHCYYLSDFQDSYWPFPCSLKMNWDGDIPN